MSVATAGVGDRVDRRLSAWLPGDRQPGPTLLRTVALACALGVIGSYVSVLREITRVVGGTDQLLAIVVTAVGIGLLVAPFVSERVVIPLSALAWVGALLLYFSVAGIDLPTLVAQLDSVLSDVLTLARGLNLIRVVEARTMALAYAPVPAFLTWYLALRGRYAAAVVPAGLALCFLVLTGDASMGPTLAGAVAATGTVAFGELARRNAGFEALDVLTIVLVTMILCALFVPFVPGGGESPLVEGSGPGTLEGSIAGTPDRSLISGSVELSPEVRFTIDSEEPAYWRTGIYDRYTGDEWITTGGSTAYDGPLSTPPGRTDRLTQTVTVESPVQVMPAAASARSIDGEMTTFTEVDEHGQIYPSVPLTEGDQYTVESAVIDLDPSRLHSAGSEYPESIAARYLQQSDGQSDAFAARTDAIVEGADSPYETALRIESHLRDSKSYSLDVDRPDGDTASAFLLEMDEGYCVYFATTMVMMLREEGIPARYATGYTEGEQIDGDTWVVRGTDAHAWPEVYFPGVGWVPFEPTPADERDDVHQDRLESARENDNPDVDTDESEPEGPDPSNETQPGENESTTDPTDESPSTGTGNETVGETGGANGGDSSGESGFDVPTPSPEQLAMALLLVLGLAAAGYRSGLSRVVVGTIRLYWQRRSGEPARDAERAYRRLEILLGRRYRPRRPAESPRAYLDALSSEVTLDERVYDVALTRERATYGSGVTPADAEAAIDAVDALVGRYGPTGGRHE
ncbi:transglutaminase domain-containing protein [Halovivax cerinus]|uniref:Transglutaminase domain-containing protein n=1 Tax=Halovivax cerinus TaxID=1487865 RepID=A0ABD5NTC8_9EURY|nr:transglutaminase domain-containing protein [Halovivax cerinus]